jgi:hypothetical protein
MVCFLPFYFFVLTRSPLYHIVIPFTLSLSLSIYIYTEYIESDDFPTRKNFYFERKEERAAFAKQHPRDQLL